MKSSFNAVVSNFDRLFFRFIVIVACFTLAGIALVCLYQVFARFILEQASPWSEALARTLMVWTVYLGSAVALRRGMAVTMSVVAEMMPRPVKMAVDLFVSLAVAFVLVVTFWYGILLSQKISNQSLAGLDIPIVWAYTAVPAGAVLGLIAMLFRQIESWSSAKAETSSFAGEVA